MQISVHDQRCNGCEGEPIGESEGGAQEQWRVCTICFLVEGKVLGDDARHIIWQTGVVVRAGVAYGQELCKPSSGVVQAGCHDDVEQNDTDESVGDSVPGVEVFGGRGRFRVQSDQISLQMENAPGLIRSHVYSKRP